ncbi:hypothetical protein WJX74_006122 [Apatococcus lobatus]|uniref:Uncharacterized protein n=1 Tax=Apatococcus lobatus TaxID=904363 RepID=A0AAW1R071_9CHLO
MQHRQAHQTTVSSRGYLPYPLNPPYYVNRTEEYQKRVFDYARNYFTPAEMGDLTRLEIFFVPQEAERIKRNLRRKGDFDETDVSRIHPSVGRDNTVRRVVDVHDAEGQRNLLPGDEDANVLANAPFNRNDLDNFSWYPGMAQTDVNEVALDIPDDGPTTGRVYASKSFLRRVELFIASMFVFDCAHGLLAHLHEEAVSLTSHGTQADEALLKQIVRNIRGFSFRRLVRVGTTDTAIDLSANPDALAPTDRRTGDKKRPDLRADSQGRLIDIRDDPRNPDARHAYRPAMPCPMADNPMDDYTLEDLPEPLSSTELTQLQREGWIRRNDRFYAPTRFPSSLAQHVANRNDVGARAINASVLDASRSMGIYPVSFLTNTTIADDACAARLIEHCGAETMDPQMFSWGMRRQVFMPLEVDVADIYRFQDLKTYDEIHEALNAFSNGMFAGISVRGMWADYIRPRLSQVVTQVPVNQIAPFPNIIKHIEMPAVSGEMRHTAGQAEIIRLYNKADDILNKINQWFLFGGDFSKVSYDDYRYASPNDPQAVIGNTAFATGWGQRALGINRCGAGYEPVDFSTNPQTDRNARAVPRTVRGAMGGEVDNPEAQYQTCAPRVGRAHTMMARQRKAKRGRK